MRYFYSFAFVTSMFLTSVYVSVVATLMLPFPFRWRFWGIRYFSVVNLWVLKHFCRINYVVEGTENIPDESCIIFSKHQSMWETMAVQLIFPPLTFVVKRELLKLPFFGWGLKSLEPIAIDRKSGRRAIVQIVKQGIDRLSRGIWLVIYPEGTRSAPGTRQKYKIGGAILAAKSGHKVVPVAHNAGEFWPKGIFLRQKGTIKMIIGPPIETQNREAEAILKEAECWIETTMKQISTFPNYPEPEC